MANLHDNQARGRSINVRLGVAEDDGGVWTGVGVCLACQPDTDVRRTFSHDEPCPRCGGPGELEWRRTPDIDHLAAGITTKLRWPDRADR
ncbi:hypothetical protein [Amycolatopsis sp. NPDC051903]|uniref:hypothetical protein n=1 Tax=Amycolatopsis sp. NPDC051903 TaxID=3363936 RepID=UPI0037A0D065